MNAGCSMWNSWPLGNGPPVYYYPPAPTSTDYGDDESSLSIPFDLVTAADDIQYAANILAALKERQRSAPTRKTFQNTDDHPRVVENQEEIHDSTNNENLEEGPGDSHKGENQRVRNNGLHPPMRKGGFHIPGAFPNDVLRDAVVSYHVLSIPEEQEERTQPTVEEANNGIKPQQPAIIPLNPDFLIPSKPPSPILPKATEPNNTLGPIEIRSMWHNYYTSLDRASEARYIKALRKAGYTVTKRSAREISRRKKESRRQKAARNDVKEPWYMYCGSGNGPESMESRPRNWQADQHGVRVSNPLEPETQSRVQPSKPAVTQNHASRKTKQQSGYNSSYGWSSLSTIPSRLPGHRRPIPEGLNILEIRDQDTGVALKEWQAKLANEEERGLRLDKKCEELARLTKKQPLHMPSAAELKRRCKPIPDRLKRKREKAEQKREAKLKKVVNLQNTFKIPETKLPEIKLPEIKLPDIELPEIKLPETQSPETNLPKDPSPPSSPILSPVIYFRNTEPHSPSYMMSGALPFEYVDVDMEDTRSGLEM